MTVYINPSPGSTGAQVTLKVYAVSKSADATGLALPSLQDVTLNNANDVFAWQSLDSSAKKQVATVSTNSLSMNIVLDTVTFFGTGTGSTAAGKGIFGLSKDKTIVEFELYMGDDSEGANTRMISGFAYVTGLAPSVSAASPIWVSPITLTVTGDYTVTTVA
jgi:hypothetical protein